MRAYPLDISGVHFFQKTGPYILSYSNIRVVQNEDTATNHDSGHLLKITIPHLDEIAYTYHKKAHHNITLLLFGDTKCSN